ncbi:hypothetical protein HDV06_002022 [Boothiomyces sp. JEL0866]|nr:hypothetical protein HDV06_002022 [Boothiomyces sp. JEL0866]
MVVWKLPEKETKVTIAHIDATVTDPRVQDCVYPPNAEPYVSQRFTPNKNLQLNDSEIAYRLIKLGTDLNLSNQENYVRVELDTTLSQSNTSLSDSEYTTPEFLVGIDQMFMYISHLSKISRDFFIKHYERSSLFGYSVRAGYYFHHDFYDFEVKTKFWLDQAVSKFPLSFSENPQSNILGTLFLAALHFKMNKCKEGLVYFRFAVEMAKEVGINREESMKQLSNYILEEDWRSFWWWLFHIDRNLEYVGSSFIKDSDNGVLLPDVAINGQYSKTARLGISAMAAEDWFTPSFKDLTPLAYRPLLNRMYGKSLRLNYYYRTNLTTIDITLVEATLSDSLNLWHACLPKEFLELERLIYDPTTIVPDKANMWFVLETMIQYHLTKILVITPSVHEEIQKGEVIEHRYFRLLFTSSKSISDILTYFLSNNPGFNYIIPLILNYVFQSTVTLISVMDLIQEHEDTHIEQIFNTHIEALKVLSEVQQRGSYITELINQLLSVSGEPKRVVIMLKKAEYDKNPLSVFIPSIWGNS